MPQILSLSPEGWALKSSSSENQRASIHKSHSVIAKKQLLLGAWALPVAISWSLGQREQIAFQLNPPQSPEEPVGSPALSFHFAPTMKQNLLHVPKRNFLHVYNPDF